MLEVLLESHAARPRPLGSTIASALMHGAIVAAAVALTLPDRGDVRVPAARLDSIIRFVLPPRGLQAPRSAGAPTARDEVPTLPDLPTIAAPIVTPVTIPPVGDIGPMLIDQIRMGSNEPGGGNVLAGAGRSLDSGTGDVVDAGSADRAPRILGGAIEPRYPSQLREAGTEGRVVAEFVIDTLGRAELDDLRFLAPTNPLFRASIREAIARYRFVPGEIGGRRVRTRVQLPFEFRLRR